MASGLCSEYREFFLDFIDNPQILKFSYAASFGTSSPIYSDKEKRICGDLIKKFDAVSVRERSGVDVICNFGWSNGCEEVVLDPTMLLDLKSYEQFIIPSNEEDYAVAYILDMNEDKEWVERYSKRTCFANEKSFFKWNATFFYGNVVVVFA